MEWLIEKKAVAGFGLALAALIVVSVTSYRNTLRFKQSTKQVEQTYQVIDNLERVRSQLKDAETGQRGYLLTGNESYLEPYRSAIALIKPEIQVLRQLTLDNQNQQRQLDKLESLATAKLAELEQTITLRKTKGINAALQVVRTDKGKQVMDEIRRVTADMEREENQLLQQRSQQAEDEARNTAWIVLLGSSWAVLLVAGAIYLLNRDISKRQQVEEQVRTLNAELEARVAERTAQLQAANHAKDELLVREQSARAEAQAAQAQITNILERVTDGFFALDNQWRFTYLNSQAVQILQVRGLSRTREELLGENIWEVFPDAVGTIFDAEYHRAVAEQATAEFEGFYPTLNLWVAASAYPSSDGLSVYFRDITERKRAEEMLRLSEARFNSLVESNIIGILLADFQGNIIEANDAFLKMVGYTREDLQQGRVRWQDMTPPEYLPQDERVIQQLKATGADATLEKEYICSDGSRIPVLVGVALLEGTSQNCVAFVLDLTERKRLEQTLRQQAEELAKANRLKDEFLAIVSHELRTPLNSILGWAQLLLSSKMDAARIVSGLETIERNAQSQKQIVEDILDVSSIVRGQMRLNVSPQNLVPIIQAAIDAVYPAAEAKNIQLTCVLNPSAGLVLGDAARLQQIFWNLLSNAIKFTPQGGRVEVQLEPGDSEVELRVSDTGIGISPDFLPYVFDRFRQADSSRTRTYGGLGLGLAIARQLIELHGGTIRAESPGEGQGATFIVRLPVRSVQPAENLPPTSGMVKNQVSLDDTSVLAGLSVLVVDDEADTRELISTVLRLYGAQVSVASSTAEAFCMLERWKPDVLVSDIGMPDENGYVLIRRVRNLDAQRGGKIPAIALTAYAHEEDKRHALKAGFQTHLSKPVEPAELVTVVANLVATARNR